MRIVLLIAAAAALGLSGCDWRESLRPSKWITPSAPDRLSIVSVGFRRGLSSAFVLQVGNLSSVQGIEAKVHVFNGGKSADSTRFVIPTGRQKDFGVLEMGWGFAPGDRGCVSIESHPTRVYFAVLPDGQYGVLYSGQQLPDEEVSKLDFSKALRTVR